MKLAFKWDRGSHNQNWRILDDMGGVHMASLHEAELINALEAARSAFGNIRTLIDGRIDTEDRPDGEGVRPNIFGYIDNECAVGLGEAP